MSSRPPPTPPVPVDPPTGRQLPDGPAVAYLVELSGAHPGAQHRLGASCVVGRAVDADVKLSASDVSRRHARIRRDDDGVYHLEDLGSRHGVRINGVASVGGALQSGDRIGFGSQVVLLFTMRDRVEERLLHSQRMAALGRLAGGVAHDFNNLIAAVVTNLSYLQRLPAETTLGDPAITETLSDCHAALERASELTKGLLGFARRGQHASEMVDVAELVHSVARLLRDQADGSAGPEVQAVTSGVVVQGDPAQLQQVIMNVCLNALDATDRDGRVVARARPAVALDFERLGLPAPGEPQVLVQVEDDGTGMDDQTQQRAFEPFFTTKPVGKGTGLGLASTYGIVEHHGGTVHIESALGEGTTVHIFLPAAGAGSTASHRSTDPVGAGMASATVLVVDDEPLVRGSTSRFLRLLGYEVHEADSGPSALAALDGARPDVVLLDLRMPHMDGAETFRALRAKIPDLPVILVSATADEEAARRLLDEGAIGVLAKPFDALRLGEVVRGTIRPQT